MSGRADPPLEGAPRCLYCGAACELAVGPTPARGGWPPRYWTHANGVQACATSDTRAKVMTRRGAFDALDGCIHPPGGGCWLCDYMRDVSAAALTEVPA